MPLTAIATWFMMHLHLMAGIAMGMIFLIAGLCLVTIFVNPWRIRKCTEAEVVMDVHPMWRLTLGMCGGLILSGAGLLWGRTIYGGTVLGSFEATVFFKALGFIEGSVALIFGVILISGMGATRLRFDLERRRYFYRSSLLGHHALSGSIDNVKVIRISIMTRSKSSEEFAAVQAGRKRAYEIAVYFDWNVRPRKVPLLVFRLQSLPKARTFAQQLADVMQIPVIEVRNPKTLY